MFKWFKGVLFGVAIGSAITSLTANKTGKERQDNLKKPLNTLTQLSQTPQKIQSLKSTHAPQLIETIEDIKASVTQFQRDNAPRFRRINEKLTQLKTDLAHFKELKK